MEEQAKNKTAIQKVAETVPIAFAAGMMFPLGAVSGIASMLLIGISGQIVVMTKAFAIIGIIALALICFISNRHFARNYGRLWYVGPALFCIGTSSCFFILVSGLSMTGPIVLLVAGVVGSMMGRKL